LDVKSNTRSLRALKGVRPIVCLTAYDAITARIAEAGGADLILVGDSVGNTVLGMPDTVSVTLDMMIHHSAAVARAKPETIIVGDLPFGLAHDSFPKLLGYCRRFLQEGGVKAVKIEGGVALAPAVARLIDAGIPVMGHVGMLPQRVHSAGYRRRGLTPADQRQLLIDAQSIDAAGAFAMVVECVDVTFVPQITAAVKCPTIGIGSGRGCDGQILVIHDLLGFTIEPPPFARPEANLHRDAVAAVKRWAAKVRSKKSR
jgi:3-methyl-2-oxobutanoate hydroxymethyltransferase